MKGLHIIIHCKGYVINWCAVIRVVIKQDNAVMKSKRMSTCKKITSYFFRLSSSTNNTCQSFQTLDKISIGRNILSFLTDKIFLHTSKDLDELFNKKILARITNNKKNDIRNKNQKFQNQQESKSVCKS